MVSAALIFGGLLTLSRFRYLLFHSLIEHACVVVFLAMFLLVWNSRRFLEGRFLLGVGAGSLPVAVMDWVHSMGFYGMPVFGEVERNLATTIWVQSRFIQASSILLAIVRTAKIVRFGSWVAGWSALAVLFLGLDFLGWFPVSYREGTGLTPFKIGMEIFVCAEFLVALVLLRRSKASFDPELLALWTAFLGLAVLSEAMFCLYHDVYGVFNAMGHVLKAASCLCMYRAIIAIGLNRPYALLFREVKLREQALEKTLEGILPICSGCKKIRDDHGGWVPIETYLHSRTQAEFTHGICPDCIERLYPDYRGRPAS